MITSKRSMQLGGKTIPLPNPQGRLKVAEHTDVTVSGSGQFLAVGNASVLSFNFGAFTLPKNALLKKVVVIGTKTPIATGIIAACDMAFGLGGTAGLLYRPPSSALTPLADLTLFKSAAEGMIDCSFGDDPVFIAANTSLNPSAAGYSSFVLNDQFSASMYLFFTLL